MPNVEIEALSTLTWIRQGSRAIVVDGPGLRALIEKGRVKVIREDVELAPMQPPTLEELAAL